MRQIQGDPAQGCGIVLGYHGLIIFLPVRGRSIVLAKNVLFVTKIMIGFAICADVGGKRPSALDLFGKHRQKIRSRFRLHRSNAI
jgi:hypothetical protein